MQAFFTDKFVVEAKEPARLAQLKKIFPGANVANVVKFSILDRREGTGQLVLPDGITSQFRARCVDATKTPDVPDTQVFPQFSYNSAALRTAWKIGADVVEPPVGTDNSCTVQ